MKQYIYIMHNKLVNIYLWSTLTVLWIERWINAKQKLWWKTNDTRSPSAERQRKVCETSEWNNDDYVAKIRFKCGTPDDSLVCRRCIAKIACPLYHPSPPISFAFSPVSPSKTCACDKALLLQNKTKTQCTSRGAETVDNKCNTADYIRRDSYRP